MKLRAFFTCLALIATLAWGSYAQGWRALNIETMFTGEMPYFIYLPYFQTVKYHKPRYGFLGRGVFVRSKVSEMWDGLLEIETRTIQSNIYYDHDEGVYLLRDVLTHGGYGEIGTYDSEINLLEVYDKYDVGGFPDLGHIVKLCLSAREKTSGRNVLLDGYGICDQISNLSKINEVDYTIFLTEDQWEKYSLISAKPIEVKLLKHTSAYEQDWEKLRDSFYDE